MISVKDSCGVLYLQWQKVLVSVLSLFPCLLSFTSSLLPLLNSFSDCVFSSLDLWLCLTPTYCWLKLPLLHTYCGILDTIFVDQICRWWFWLLNDEVWAKTMVGLVLQYFYVYVFYVEDQCIVDRFSDENLVGQSLQLVLSLFLLKKKKMGIFFCICSPCETN